MRSDGLRMLPGREPAVPYSTVRPKLATGDLFFLQTTTRVGRWIEKLEEQADLPPYSHVGMVIKDDVNLLLWDAPGGGDCFVDPYARDDPDNRLYGLPVEHPGCRVSVLDNVLAYYATKVHVPKGDVPGFWARQLTPPVTGEQFTALRKFINRVDGLPFLTDLGYFPLVANFAAGQRGTTLYVGTYFCSQLVADSYMHMGLLKMDARPPNAYAPAHFGIDTADFGMTDPPPLVPPAALGDVFFVTWDRSPGHGTPCEQEAW
jgi:hypothetical protein